MGEDLIRYDILTQQALLGMIGDIIDEVSKAGLPGDHHFFITFLTQSEGVKLSQRMREKYPDEMTIVVQHRFWDLEVQENGFQIGLSFDDIPELLFIPFTSIKGFYDPSVKFGLQFDLDASNQANTDHQTNSHDPLAKPPLFEEADIGSRPNQPKDTENSKKSSSKEKQETEDESGAEVVSLDQFRKKK